mgnify:CR=1 FL=1
MITAEEIETRIKKEIEDSLGASRRRDVTRHVRE